jgi:hypothetical protein
MHNYLIYWRRTLAATLATAALLAGCARPEVAPSEPAVAPPAPKSKLLSDFSTNAVATGFPETFETGTKTAYTSGTVALGSGSWTFNDALLGNTSADPKTGTQSARVRNSGTLTMNFNLPSGAGVVTLAHARYGTDAAGTWEL